MSEEAKFDGFSASSSEASMMMVVAVSSRALFHLEDENEIFIRGGQSAFDAHMLASDRKPLKPGVAFPIVRRLLALNSPGRKDRVTVIVLSRNSPAAGTRVMRSINELGLDVQKAVFTSGSERFRYAEAMGTDLVPVGERGGCPKRSLVRDRCSDGRADGGNGRRPGAAARGLRWRFDDPWV